MIKKTVQRTQKFSTDIYLSCFTCVNYWNQRTFHGVKKAPWMHWNKNHTRHLNDKVRWSEAPLRRDKWASGVLDLQMEKKKLSGNVITAMMSWTKWLKEARGAERERRRYLWCRWVPSDHEKTGDRRSSARVNSFVQSTRGDLWMEKKTQGHAVMETDLSCNDSALRTSSALLSIFIHPYNNQWYSRSSIHH